MRKDGILYTVIFTFIITLLIVGILAFVNELTKKTVQTNNEIVLKRAVLNTFKIKYSDNNDLLLKYNTEIKENILKIDNEEVILYSTEIDHITNYALIFSGSGLWGTINGVLAVDEYLSNITGMEIISHNETPGLGGRIDEPFFKNQFTDLYIPGNSISIVSSGNRDNGEIDAISGATLTSKLFEKIINNTLLKLKDYLELLDE